MTPTGSDAITAAAPELIAEALRRFGEARMRGVGTSMLPAVGPRDVLLIRRCTLDQVSPGDVVLYALGGRLFAHRVVRIGSDGEAFLVTRGDTLADCDPPVRASQLLGRVDAAERDGRTRAAPFRSSVVARTWARVAERVRGLARPGVGPWAA